jgi:hypothetical protein
MRYQASQSKKPLREQVERRHTKGSQRRLAALPFTRGEGPHRVGGHAEGGGGTATCSRVLEAAG